MHEKKASFLYDNSFMKLISQSIEGWRGRFHDWNDGDEQEKKIPMKNFRLTLEGLTVALTFNRPFITDRIKHPY
jgi:hypothetical protein